MKKVIKLVAVMIFGMFLMACGSKALSSDYNEETLKTTTENIIANLENEKYDEVNKIASDELKDKLSVDVIKKAWEPVKEKVGKYDSLSKINFAEKDGNVVVIAQEKYEKGKVQFTISFNKDMKLVGFYIK